MSRLTDNDKTLGIFTFGKTNWKTFHISINSGGEEGCPFNHLMIYGRNFAFRIRLFNLIKPYRKKVMVINDVKRFIESTGRNYYYNVSEREFGVSINDGHVSIFFGKQTGDSKTERQKSWFLPWTQWRMVSHELYDTEGNVFYSHNYTGDPLKDIQELIDAEKTIPKVKFEIEDYDKERIVATTHVEKRIWKRGTNGWKWLSLFFKDKVSRSLDIKYSSEVGPEKGSYKGGVVGHGVDMLDHETHCQAFARYCGEYRFGRGSKTNIKLIRSFT